MQSYEFIVKMKFDDNSYYLAKIVICLTISVFDVGNRSETENIE